MSSAQPTLSVIVPTFNRSAQLRSCLKALLEQDIDPAQYEVIVVVDGSTDETENMLLSIRTRCRFCFVSQSNSGAASARNRGVSLAQGQIVVFVDDDMLVDPGFVRAHLDAHHRHNNSAIVGSVKIVPGELAGAALTVYKDLQNRQINYLVESRLHSPFDALIGNFSLHRHILLNLGGFDTSLRLCEDFDLGIRLLAANIPIWYCADAKSTEVYTRGVELVTRDAYYRGIANGIIAKKYARAGIILDFQRFFRGNLFKTAARRLIWYSAPALSSLVQGLTAIGSRSPTAAKIVDQSIVARMISGVLYWSGLKKSLGSLRELKRLARPRLVVLGYHMVEDNLPKSFAPYGVKTSQLRWQMEWLHKNGYRAIDLSEWLSICRGESDPPSKTVSITFDDGYRDLIDRVLPILSRYSIRPVVFVVAGGIGAENFWDTKSGFPSRSLLDAEDIQQLSAAGAEIGSHTYNHRSLTNLPEGEQRWELETSRKMLETLLAGSIKSFSYPYGNYTRRLTELVRNVGYDAACGSSPGWNYSNANPYLIRRSFISSRTTRLGFIMRVRFPSIIQWVTGVELAFGWVFSVARHPYRSFLSGFCKLVDSTRLARTSIYIRADVAISFICRVLRIRRFNQAYFESKFRNLDPWRIAEREYERQKYRETLDLLKGISPNTVLEVGCAEGLFSEMLARHVGALISIDISERALQRARLRCAMQPNVSFLKLDILRDPLPKRFDLVVCSEVLCYVETQQALVGVCRKIADAVEPAGRVVLVNMRIAREHAPGWSARDLAFGADSIHSAFQKVSGFALLSEQWNDFYTISLFQKKAKPTQNVVEESGRLGLEANSKRIIGV